MRVRYLDMPVEREGVYCRERGLKDLGKAVNGLALEFYI